MRLLLSLVAVSALLATAGCVYSYAPVNAGIVASQKGPYITAIDNAAASNKVGRAKAEGILIVGFGDASIATAMKEAGITKIHHIDTEIVNVIGIYSRYETVVYGE